MKNTIDVTVDVYHSNLDFDYRVQVRPDADLEGVIVLSYQELDKNKEYINKSSLSFDQDEWEKIKKAVDICFKNTI